MSTIKERDEALRAEKFKKFPGPAKYVEEKGGYKAHLVADWVLKLMDQYARYVLEPKPTERRELVPLEEFPITIGADRKAISENGCGECGHNPRMYLDGTCAISGERCPRADTFTSVKADEQSAGNYQLRS
jgi:hypothetical protein